MRRRAADDLVDVKRDAKGARIRGLRSAVALLVRVFTGVVVGVVGGVPRPGLRFAGDELAGRRDARGHERERNEETDKCSNRAPGHN